MMRRRDTRSGPFRAFRALSTVGMATVTLAAATVFLTGSAAQAGCAHGYSDKDVGSDQVIAASGTAGVNMRTGPHVGCSRVVMVPDRHWVTLDCYIENGDNVGGYESWSRVRYGNGGPLYVGWIPDAHLRERGSTELC
ncbi:hypothetical protein [Plantactinospora sp. CA-290183]|uniref:hypothetical protein n=1 Tax=Plantactinospora sp. CA-290183 TaxID=3240006 RepID=UPI003D8D7D28